jgi:hypothetical protein
MGQASTQVGSVSDYVERWRIIFPSSGTRISEHLAQQVRQAVESVLVKHNLSTIAQVLDDDRYVFDYAVANILPEHSEGFRVNKAVDLTALLEGEFGAWYFLGFGQRLTETHLRHTLQSRGFPLYYERYLAHWLLQYSLLLLDAANLGNWPQEPKMAATIKADFVQVFEEYVVTEAHRAGMFDFNMYIDQLVGLRFHSQSPVSVEPFRTDVLRNSELDQPAMLLVAIESSDYFRLSSMHSSQRDSEVFRIDGNSENIGGR